MRHGPHQLAQIGQFYDGVFNCFSEVIADGVFSIGIGVPKIFGQWSFKDYFRGNVSNIKSNGLLHFSGVGTVAETKYNGKSTQTSKDHFSVHNIRF
jgi:hypothetical protein